jgi:hypothetical protein
MPEPIPNPPEPKPRAPKPSGALTTEAGHTPLSEEFDRARWTMPPAAMIGAGLLVFAAILGAVVWFGRYTPTISGGVSDVFAVEQAGGEAVLLTAHVTLQNDTDKALFIKGIRGELRANNQDYKDDAANTSDFERYFTAYTDLRPHAGEPLRTETKVAPHQQALGTVVFAFPVTKQQFDARREFRVFIIPYDQREVPLIEKK